MHPAYEFRRGQLQMAQAVEQALAEKRHLIVEAGTGTGKTLAYLMPVIHSGKRVIISTGTKNLQEQLFYKDVPFLEQALYGGGEQQISRSARNDKETAGRLSVCYMKGRNNYLCRKKLYELTDQPVLSGLEEIEQYRAIAEWEKTTKSGDRAELSTLPEASALWFKLDARADTCLGQKCSEWDRCFITEMHRRAMESDIIIVNHHLFFADLAIKLQAEGAPDAGILPEAAAVIFDEAHELEDVAGNYFGISVCNLGGEDLARDVETLMQHNPMLAAGLSLIYGLMKILNLTHGSFYLWGGYLGLMVVRATGNLFLAAFVSGLAIALIGVVQLRADPVVTSKQPLIAALLRQAPGSAPQPRTRAYWGRAPRQFWLS